MFVPAIHSGTISSILGMTLKISHRTVKKLLKCWGVLWSLRCKFFFSYSLALPCQWVTQSFCYLWTFSLAMRGWCRRRHKHDNYEDLYHQSPSEECFKLSSVYISYRSLHAELSGLFSLISISFFARPQEMEQCDNLLRLYLLMFSFHAC